MSSESTAHEPDAQDATCVVEMRPALWWERQLAFIQHYVADSPQLLKQIERLGPKSNPEHVVRIDQSGRTEASKAPLGSKDWRESAHPPKPSAMPPFITGGAPEGRGHRPPFALTRGGDQYLQGVARIEGAIKHIIVLLHSPPGEQSAAVLPVLAATSTESGMAWRPIGFGMALPNRDGRGRDEVLRFEIGRMIIDAKVALPPGDALRGQLGLPIHAGHRQEPGPENRARAKVIAGRAHESASRASS